MNVRASKHAIVRVGQRPGRNGPSCDPEATLLETLASGKARSRPRRWMRNVTTPPGTRFVYSAEHPDVCLVVRDGVAVTALNRDMFAQESRRNQLSGRKPRPVPQTVQEELDEWLEITSDSDASVEAV